MRDLAAVHREELLYPAQPHSHVVSCFKIGIDKVYGAVANYRKYQLETVVITPIAKTQLEERHGCMAENLFVKKHLVRRSEASVIAQVNMREAF